MAQSLVVKRSAETSRLLAGVIMVALVAGALSPLFLTHDDALAAARHRSDFLAFYVVSQLALAGQAATAYDVWVMAQAYFAEAGRYIFMPWAYPPPTLLFSAWVSVLPIALASAVYGVVGVGLFLALLWRLGGAYTPAGLVVAFPALVVQVRTGQTGFFVASLVLVFCLALLQARPARAGVALGLLVIKPHLALGLGLLALLRKDLRLLMACAFAASAFLGLALVVFGSEVYSAFFQASQHATEFLRRGWYPLHRMLSVYASVRSFGVSAEVAMAIHVIGLVVVLGLAGYTYYRITDLRQRLGIAVLVTLAISPYGYDYDATVLAVATVLLTPAVILRASGGERLVMLLLAWVLTAWGFVAAMGFGSRGSGSGLATQADFVQKLLASAWQPQYPFTLSGVLYLMLVVLVLHVLRRPPRLQAA